jgi:hypothetical protein
MRTRTLTEQEFKETFGDSMVRAPDAESPFDVWPYLEAVPKVDFEGYDCSLGQVDNVNRNERFEHVLINSNDHNVFMVVVVDREADEIYGHRLLNLNKEYGFDT